MPGQAKLPTATAAPHSSTAAVLATALASTQLHFAAASPVSELLVCVPASLPACLPACLPNLCLPILCLHLPSQTFILADFCYYYIKSYAEGTGVIHLPAGIV